MSVSPSYIHKIREVKKEAMSVVKRRGHRVGNLKRTYVRNEEDGATKIFIGTCTLCGLKFKISDEPIFGGEFIEGKAYEKNCKIGSAPIEKFETYHMFYKNRNVIIDKKVKERFNKMVEDFDLKKK